MLAQEQLILSLFPGADLLGKAFEEEGFIVVRGPELMLGQDVHNFKGIANKFDGIIGGPPCQCFSEAVIGQIPTQENLIPEFERIVLECKPNWWLMENVRYSPIPNLKSCYTKLVDAWWYGAKQHRIRRLSSNLPLHLKSLPIAERYQSPFPCVTATEDKYNGSWRNNRRAGRKVRRRLTLNEINILMGLPKNFSTPCLLNSYAYKSKR